MSALDLSVAIPRDLAGRLAQTLVAEEPVIVATSGSTGMAKKVILPASALIASARASQQVLGGSGQWLAALSPAHIGGLGVWVRSWLAGTTPAEMPGAGAFSTGRFVAATEDMRGERRRYCSLVPTQVHRLLSDAGGSTALASFDRVLIGGAAVAPSLAARLREAGVAWTHTYGMSETCGGCVYDGIPLPGVSVRKEGAPGVAGRLLIAGPVLAQGYRARPDLDADVFSTVEDTRWFRTSDLGIFTADGPHSQSRRWQVLGRVDAVINTGGHKVHPDQVRDALTTLPLVQDAAVVGIPDAEWGQRVVTLVVPEIDAAQEASLTEDPTRWVRNRLRPILPAYAMPTAVVLTDSLPRLPGGKVDFRGVQAVFTQEDGRI